MIKDGKFPVGAVRVQAPKDVVIVVCGKQIQMGEFVAATHAFVMPGGHQFSESVWGYVTAADAERAFATLKTAYQGCAKEHPRETSLAGHEALTIRVRLGVQNGKPDDVAGLIVQDREYVVR